MNEDAASAGSVELQTPVWWMRHPVLEIFTIRPVFGLLELVGETLRFTVAGGGDRPTQLLEQFAEKPGLAEQVKSGQRVVALEVPRSEARISFGRLQLGSIMTLRTGGKTWRLAFYNYARRGGAGAAAADMAVLGATGIGGAVGGAASQLHGRAVAKPWRKALRG
jgi:hypothetical protein